jgi:hypothetical protein
MSILHYAALFSCLWQHDGNKLGSTQQKCRFLFSMHGESKEKPMATIRGECSSSLVSPAVVVMIFWSLLLLLLLLKLQLTGHWARIFIFS